jgi:hypothetical protein
MSTGPQFFQTRMGTRFYEADVPRIANALERIAAALEARTPREPETIPEQKTGESLCCDDPDCPDKDGEARAQHAREMGGTDDDHTFTVRFLRSHTDEDEAAHEAFPNDPLKLALRKQFIRELQVAYDSVGIGGSFEVLEETFDGKTTPVRGR